MGERVMVGVRQSLEVRVLVRALAICLAATAIPAALYVTRERDGSNYFYWYGFQDKRWLVALYFVWVVGLPLSLLLAKRFIVSGLSRDNSASPAAFEFLGRREVIKRLALFLFFAGLAWVLWGPPWQGPALHRGVDMHEVVHLKGYQGILTGSQPYIGAGSEQYGPISQLFVTEWIQRLGTISIAGIREAYSAMNFFAVLFVIGMCVMFLRPRIASAAIIVGVFLVPHFTFFTQTETGMAGYFGWASLWRYVGILLLGFSLPWLLARLRGLQLFVSGLFIGLVWGVTTLLAQENLLGGLLVAATVLVAFALAATPSISSVIALGGSIGAGLISIWLVYLVPYLFSGTVSGFLTNYFLFPTAVSAGFTGSSWSNESPWSPFFYVVPVLLGVAGSILALGCDLGPSASEFDREEAGTLDGSWMAAFGLFAATAVAHASVLNRSDNSHLFNSSWLFPFFLVVFLGWVYQKRRLTRILSPTLVGATVLVVWIILLAAGTRQLVPFWPAMERFVTALESRFSSNTVDPGRGPSRLDAPLDPNEEALGIGDGVTRLDAQRFSAELKSLAGNKPTYIDYSVSGSFGSLTTGYWYFAANLNPAEIPFEEDHMVITNLERNENLAALSSPGNPVSVLVTRDSGTDHSQAVLSRGDYSLAGTIFLNAEPISVYVNDGPQ